MRYLIKNLIVILSLFSIIYLPSSIVKAEIPKLINYQARLTDKSGQPLEGVKAITFRIYDAEAGGNLLWEETQNINMQSGIFNVMLGGVTNLNLAFDKPYFLEIKVESEVMSPRQRIASVGYAFRAEVADKAIKADSATNASQAAYAADADKLDGLNFNDHIAILTGTIADGGTIPLPSGYSNEQCKCMASVGEVSDSGWALHSVRTSVDSNRKVSVQYRWNNWVGGGAQGLSVWINGGIANYMIICVK